MWPACHGNEGDRALPHAAFAMRCCAFRSRAPLVGGVVLEHPLDTVDEATVADRDIVARRVDVGLAERRLRQRDGHGAVPADDDRILGQLAEVDLRVDGAHADEDRPISEDERRQDRVVLDVDRRLEVAGAIRGMDLPLARQTTYC